MNEPFLINPCHKKIKRKKKHIRIKNPLMLIGNPKGKRKGKGKDKSLSDLLNSLKKRRTKKVRRIKVKKIRRVPKIRFLIKPKRRKFMAKHRVKRGKHALTVFGRKGRVRVSKRSKLVKRSRGRMLNPSGILGRIPPMMDIIYLAGGGIITRFIPTLLPIPVKLKTGLGRIAVQGVSAIGLGYIIGKVFKQERIGRLVLMGGLVSTAITIIDSYILKGRLAEGDLSVYLPADTEVSAYLPEGSELFADEQEIVNADESSFVNQDEDEEVI